MGPPGLTSSILSGLQVSSRFQARPITAKPGLTLGTFPPHKGDLAALSTGSIKTSPDTVPTDLPHPTASPASFQAYLPLSALAALAFVLFSTLQCLWPDSNLCLD